ncbi:MAG: hypothetical protein IMF08_02835 [Proteobacteria bacterium]|nr:hypothetical protein [Pseudomonadota bacterium]
MNLHHENYATPPAHAVVTLQGDSRQIYGFTAFPLAAPIGGAGICIFACPPKDPEAFAPSWWTPLYVRGSCNMGDGSAMPRGILEQARWMGATHVLVHFCDRGDEARHAIAEDLIAALRPPLNAEGRRAAA